MEQNYKPGDFCLDCERLGLTKKLRYFYINLEEQILKCESDCCLYPYIDDDDNESIDDDAANIYAIDGNNSDLQTSAINLDMPILTELQTVKEANASKQLLDVLNHDAETVTPINFDITHLNLNFSDIKPENIDKTPIDTNRNEPAVDVKPTVNDIICMANIKKEKFAKSNTTEVINLLGSTTTTTMAGISRASIKSDCDNSKKHIQNFLAAVEAQNKQKPTKSTQINVDALKQLKKSPVKRINKYASRFHILNDRKSLVTKTRPLDFLRANLANKNTTS